MYVHMLWFIIKTVAAAVYVGRAQYTRNIPCYVSNISSAVVGTTNILGAEAFILSLDRHMSCQRVEQGICTT